MEQHIFRGKLRWIVFLPGLNEKHWSQIVSVLSWKCPSLGCRLQRESVGSFQQLTRSFQRLFCRDLTTNWMAVRDSEATNKISLGSLDLILVPQPYCLGSFYSDVLLADQFSYLLINISYRMGPFLSTSIISFTVLDSVLSWGCYLWFKGENRRLRDVK